MNPRARSRTNPRLKYPPPPNFMPAGRVLAARLSQDDPPFITETRSRGSRAQGRNYEAKVQRYLVDAYPDAYLPAPWFRYETSGSRRGHWCQPDGLLFNVRGGVITIVEVKLSHNSSAWWQVRHLYEPVVVACFGSVWRIAAVEVVRWFDPDAPFPETYCRAPDISKVPAGAFGVHIWQGRG